MNHNINPLRNIPDTKSRHLIMQILAWMWCIVFSMYFEVFGFLVLQQFHIFLYLEQLQ